MLSSRLMVAVRRRWMILALALAMVAGNFGVPAAQAEERTDPIPFGQDFCLTDPTRGTEAFICMKWAGEVYNNAFKVRFLVTITDQGLVDPPMQMTTKAIPLGTEHSYGSFRIKTEAPRAGVFRLTHPKGSRLLSMPGKDTVDTGTKNSIR